MFYGTEFEKMYGTIIWEIEPSPKPIIRVYLYTSTLLLSYIPVRTYYITGYMY